MPIPRHQRLYHVPVRLRVSIDPAVWATVRGVEPTRKAIEDDVREYARDAIRASGLADGHPAAIISVRRDGA